MNILLTGANGYIGRRLLPSLVEQGHHVICCVRDRNRFDLNKTYGDKISVYEVDFLEDIDHEKAPKEIDAAYYLIHSMNSSIDDFGNLEKKSAENFNKLIEHSGCMQVIYLGGLINEKQLSKHLESRRNVENILKQGKAAVTTLRAGIIVGSGSASFEIIRDLVEKLPVMITPRWLKTLCQPIAIRDVIKFLSGVLMMQECYDQTFDIGGPDILNYKEMLLGYAKVRKLKRLILTLPVMSPRLSSYWLYFITSTSYKLAVNLVNSMKIEMTCKENRLSEMLGIKPIHYNEAVELAFEKIEQNLVMSSWKDSFNTVDFPHIMNLIDVPSYGCFKDIKKIPLRTDDAHVMANIWSIGGEKGWYFGNFLWIIRGFLDKLAGGVGLRRGRTNKDEIHPGDALDFWRVLIADKDAKRLLLYAEMKLPGEAWLEFRIDGGNLIQTATFRPNGLKGRLYWYSLIPFHFFVFKGMAKRLVSK